MIPFSSLLLVLPLPLFHGKRSPRFQGLNRPKLASLYQRIGSSKLFQFGRDNHPGKPIQFFPFRNEWHFQCGNEISFFRMIFLPGNDPPGSLRLDIFSFWCSLQYDPFQKFPLQSHPENHLSAIF